MKTLFNTLAEHKKGKKLMQTAVIVAPGEVELQTAVIPEPARDEVRVRIEGCGLCASNLPFWQGREWFSYPMEAGAPGHEGWGTVDGVGKDVKTVKSGDRVTLLSHHAYADYDIAHAEHVVKLPDGLDGRPVPGEPLGCAMNILERSRVEAGMTVAVVGVGFLGALLVQLAKHTGARVIAITRRASSLEMAKKLGADEALQLKDPEQITEQVNTLTGNTLCERVIEATGEQEPLSLAGSLTAVRGRLIVAGYHQDGLRQVNMQQWNRRGIDVINAHERNPEACVQGMRRAVEAVEEGVLNPFPLFTHTFPKQYLQQAFQLHQQKPNGFIKALITFK